MTTHSSASKGTTTLIFSTSLGTPVEDLGYRLSDGQGNTWIGTTGKGGLGLTIVEAKGDPSSESWELPGEASLQLEVQRDDGSWKVIDNFQHGAGLHRQVNVIAGAIAVPFRMAPV